MGFFGEQKLEQHQLNSDCKETNMTKYAIHTKWSWPNGVPSPETMQA